VLSTTRAVKKGTSGEEVLRVSVLEEGIDRNVSMFNHLIGTLLVKSEHVHKDIRKGAPIEITIAVDESHHKTVSAYFPDYEVEPEPLIIDAIPVPSKSELEGELAGIRGTIDLLRSCASDDEETRRILEEVDAGGLLEEIEKNIAETSDRHPESGQMAKRDLMRLLKLIMPVAPKAHRLGLWKLPIPKY
jgi:hypothetical protein